MSTPSLKTAWDKQAELLVESTHVLAWHTTPGGTLEACRHNASLLVKHVEQAFRDAGYFPMMLLLGTVVQPVINTGRQCIICEAAALDPEDEETPGHLDGLASETGCGHIQGQEVGGCCD